MPLADSKLPHPAVDGEISKRRSVALALEDKTPAPPMPCVDACAAIEYGENPLCRGWTQTEVPA